MEATERFEALAGLSDEAVPLDEIALLVAAHAIPGLDVDAYMAKLDDLAGACPAPTLDGLVGHLFAGGRFRGNADDYYDPRNSFLDVVLTRRRGLPILLATVMIEVGRRRGIPVVGVGMPMHFLVRSADDPDVFADPFTGAALDRRGARARFEALSAGRLPWEERHLEPTVTRLIVVRMLTNLRASYERRRDAVHLALVARMRASIPELRAEEGDAVRLSAVFN